MKRRYGTKITRRCKLLCPVGCEMQRVVSIAPVSLHTQPVEDTFVTLKCGHVRGELLPTRGVSLEQISTEQGHSLFPYDRREPEPEPVSRPEPSFVNLSIEPTRPKTFTGRDESTGLEREYTQREIDRMGAPISIAVRSVSLRR